MGGISNGVDGGEEAGEVGVDLIVGAVSAGGEGDDADAVGGDVVKDGAEGLGDGYVDVAFLAAAAGDVAAVQAGEGSGDDFDLVAFGEGDVSGVVALQGVVMEPGDGLEGGYGGVVDGDAASCLAAGEDEGEAGLRGAEAFDVGFGSGDEDVVVEEGAVDAPGACAAGDGDEGGREEGQRRGDGCDDAREGGAASAAGRDVVKEVPHRGRVGAFSTLGMTLG